MATFALISDLHSNLEALEAVFERIDALGVTEVNCLGDVIGYGADPEACARLVMERCGWTIMGNHDWGLFNELDRFNPLASDALQFTRRRLQPGLFTWGRSGLWKFLAGLPDRMEAHGYLFFHGSPRDPIMEYVLKSDGFLEQDKMTEIFSLIDRPCFIGHTHWPGIYRSDLRFVPAKGDCTRFEIGEDRAVINVGSVGQPRDGDPRASFAVVSEGCVEIHRVGYDFRGTQTKILAAGLHPVLAERLARGK